MHKPTPNLFKHSSTIDYKILANILIAYITYLYNILLLDDSGVHNEHL